MGIDAVSLRLNATELDVLGRVDGVASAEQIARALGLDAAQVEQSLERLASKGAVTLKAIEPMWVRGLGRVGAVDPDPVGPDDALDPAPDMPIERRAQIDRLFPLLGLVSHYEVLGVAREAEAAAIRTAYFEQSKAFHPDTVFRKNVGPYRARMEAIFKRLTESYEVLSKRKSRAAYDATLPSTHAGPASPRTEGSAGRSRRAPSVAPPASERAPSVAPPASSRAPSVPPPAAARAPSVAPPPPLAPPKTAAPARAAEPVDEPASGPARASSPVAVARARELAARHLRGGAPARPPANAVTDAARRPVPAVRDQHVRGLAMSLRETAAQTGGLDPIERHVLEGRRLEEAGDLAGALREMRLAALRGPDRPHVQLHLQRVARSAAVAFADVHRQQAEQEEQRKMWSAAAVSWGKVCDGRPDEPEAHVRAAVALVEASGDLHAAQRLARRACELRDDVASRRTLARVYMAAGLTLNARRELERARTLDPSDRITETLLRELKV